MKFFQKLLVAPATASVLLLPNLNGFANESFEYINETNGPEKDNELIAQASLEDDDTDTLKISVTGTRSPREVKDVPASVSVIEKEDIDSRGISDLRDLFKYDAGVSIMSNSRGYFNSYGQNSVNIRGMDRNRVLMQRDDINLPARYTFSEDFGRGDYVDLSTLKAVEIFKGPASSLYGSEALGGVVSYRSLYPEDLLKGDDEFALEVPFTHDGSSKKTSGTTRIALRDDQSGLEGIVVATKSYGEEENVKAQKKYIDDSEINKLNFYTNIVKNLDDYSRFNVIYETVSTNRITSQATDTLSSSHSSIDEDVDIDRWMAQVGYEFDNPDSELFFDYAKVNSYKQYARWDDRSWVEYPAGVSRYTGLPTAAKSVYNDYYYKDDSEGINIQLRSDSSSGGWNHSFTYGMDYSDTFNSRPRKKFTTESGATTEETIKDAPDANTSKYGFYLQDSLKFDRNEKVELIAGLRYDKYKIKAKSDASYVATVDGVGVTNPIANLDTSTINPSLSLIYKLSPDLSAYGKYATAFRAPTFAELNQAHGNRMSGYYFISNPDLKPETSNNYEVGLKGDYEKVDFSLVGFLSKYDDLIERTVRFDGTGCPSYFSTCMVYQANNVDEAEIYGWEFSSEYNFNEREDGISLISSLAYSHGNDQDDKPLESIEPFKAILGLKYTLPNNKMTVELINTYAGKPRTSSALGQNPAESYSVLDFIGNFNVNERLAFDIGVYNLNDKRYFNYSTVKGMDASEADINRFSEPGRSLKGGFTFKF